MLSLYFAEFLMSRRSMDKVASIGIIGNECERILFALPGLCAAKVAVVSMGDLAVSKCRLGLVHAGRGEFG